MKFKISIVFLSSAAVFSYADQDFGVRNIDNSNDKSQNSQVKWVGYVVSDGGHTDKHDHNIKFIRESDSETFDVIDSPALEKVHCQVARRILVEIKGERTPRKLFWGNNLIVKNFRILDVLEELPHRIYRPRLISAGAP